MFYLVLAVERSASTNDSVRRGDVERRRVAGVDQSVGESCGVVEVGVRSRQLEHGTADRRVFRHRHARRARELRPVVIHVVHRDRQLNKHARARGQRTLSAHSDC